MFISSIVKIMLETFKQDEWGKNYRYKKSRECFGEWRILCQPYECCTLVTWVIAVCFNQPLDE